MRSRALPALVVLLLAGSSPAQDSPSELLELRRALKGAVELGIDLPFLEEFPPGQFFGEDLHLQLFAELDPGSDGPDPGTLAAPDPLELDGAPSAVCAIFSADHFPGGVPAAGDMACLEPDWRDLRAVAGIEDSVLVLPVRGSGFRVSGNWIATASHLFACDQAGQYFAVFGYVEKGGEETFCFSREQVYAIDCVVAHESRAASDWTLVQTSRSIEGDYAELGEPRPVSPGEDCHALGHPFGLPLRGVGPASIQQVDSYGSASRTLRFHTLLYTLSGMSGGPVLSPGAELLGLHTDGFHCSASDPPVCPLACTEFVNPPCGDPLCCSSTESGMDGLGRFVRVRNLSSEDIVVRVAGQMEYVAANSQRDLYLPPGRELRLLTRARAVGRPGFATVGRLDEVLAASARRPLVRVEGRDGVYRARVVPGG